MKSLAVVFLMFTAVTAGKVCKSGSVFKVECNFCTCSPDGNTFVCTDMMCPPEMKDDVKNEKLCEPRQKLQMGDCNSCICSEDGTKAECTLGLCKRSAAKYCTPGTVFSPDNCNTCRCNADGTMAACTLTMCRDNKLDVIDKPKQICQPRSAFKEYCNVCSCADDGLSYACTRMWCDKTVWNKDGTQKKEIEQPKNFITTANTRVCSPNSAFKESCNTCVCSHDGMSKACTMMECNGNAVNEGRSLDIEEHQSVRSCEPGSVFSPDGCNTCICNKYGTKSACTLKLCPEIQKRSYEVENAEKWGPAYHQGDACSPGKIFYSECNRCVCTNTGNSAYCTLMLCKQ